MKAVKTVLSIIVIIVPLWQLFFEAPLIPTLYWALGLKRIAETAFLSFFVIWALFPQKISLPKMRRIIGAIAFAMLCEIVWNSAQNTAPKKNHDSSAETFCIPETNANYESFLKANKFGEPGASYSKLNEAALNAFKAGDYAYSAIILETVDQDTLGFTNASWQANRPILAASELAKNPTSAGYDQFYKSLDDLVSRIEDQLKDGKRTCFGNPAYGVLSDVLSRLGVVENQLPESRRQYIEEIAKKIQEIQASLASQN